MSAFSTGLAWARRLFASPSAFQAAFAWASSTTGLLMWGPFTSEAKEAGRDIGDMMPAATPPQLLGMTG